MADARTLHQELTARLEKRGPLLHMFDDMWENASFEIERFVKAFKSSPQYTECLQAKTLGESHVSEDDFHQFRVLGVGGFGSVNAALKRDTGMMVAI